MQVISWSDFGIKGRGNRESFEELCLHLFCRKHGLSEGVSGDFNQKGLETQPVKVGKRTYGFQAKYFDTGIDYRLIRESIEKALEDHGDVLDEICIYINSDAKPHSSKAGKEIVELAKKRKVKIVWFTKTNFSVSLAQPINFDLTQLYFGLGADFEFIRDSADHKKLTLLKSKTFLDLNFSDSSAVRTTSLDKDILKLNERLVLLSGDPASGKSTAIHKLFLDYSGMNEADDSAMLNIITTNQAVPQVINLKYCISDSLEDIIRSRQNDFRVRGSSISVIYLLDGLDEISEDRADLIMLQISDLARKSSTKKIIVSCRTGNLNKIKLRNYFDDFVEYKIEQLTLDDLDKYFAAKNISSKTRLFEKLKKTNPQMLSGVTDVLGLKLLWETIETLDENSSIFDLYEIKIKRILSDPSHYKNLNSLNLPNQKERAILNLNEKISYRFQAKFQFLFPLKQLQDLIMFSYPKTDYTSVNLVINYIASLFFDNPDPDGGDGYYVYTHRRYQEYFFVKKLQQEYTKDPSVLRRLSILSNQELLQTFFMKGLQRFYATKNNLVGCLDISLLDVYLGNHSGWGVDSPYYINSSSFIDALLLQNDEVFNALYEDESLKLKDKIDIDVVELEKQFKIWHLDQSDYGAEHYLVSTWESGLGWLIQRVVDFWSANRKDIANQLIGKIIIIQDLYKKYDFPKLMPKERRQIVGDPYWEHYESYLYYLICIKGDTVSKVLKERVQPYLKLEENEHSYSNNESGKEKVVNSFLRILLKNKPEKIAGLFGKFDDFAMLSLLKLGTDLSNLEIFINHTRWHGPIRVFLENNNLTLSKSNYHLIFYKKLFGLNITDVETSFMTDRRQEIVKERDIDWHMHEYHVEFAMIAYVFDEYSFEQELINDGEHHLHYYSERVVYSALFRSYIQLLRKETSLEKIYRLYVQYCEINYSGMPQYGQALRVSISKIWAYIYVSSDSTNETKTLLKDKLFDELHVGKYVFFITLSSIDPELFSKVMSESDLKEFEDELDDWKDDFQSKTDRYLELSLMYKIINPKKASNLFIKAIIDGTLRHGWRKDPIIRYQLLYALEILLEHKWIKEEDLPKILDQVFDLVMRAIQISDGSGTSRGPYTFISIVAKYDRQLAAMYRDRYVEDEGRRNISNSINTPIVLSKVSAGFPMDDIEESLDEFYQDYDYEGKPKSDSYDEKFVVYVAIAQNDLYTEDEKKEALEKALSLINDMDKAGVSYYLGELEYKDTKVAFINLCEKYNISQPLKLSTSKDSYSHDYSKINEDNFVREVISAQSQQKIRAIYNKLSNYKNGIELQKADSWKSLIDKTYEQMGNIAPFINYMKACSYPHTDFYATNSKHLHLALAYALDNPNYKTEALQYLFYNGGHEGFFNVMKAYAEIGDKEMCLNLFQRFMSLCKLLTD